MEYVEGEPVTTHCWRSDLGLTDRLELFSAVCNAVCYAHGRLVVHRDLKPSNVLVTPDGAVKLVDFGIAKVLDRGHGVEEGTALTAQGIRPLTPEYASPEQIRGEAVTVVSDVYALGVLLYQLLVGRSPYPTPLSTHEEIRRAVCEVEPLLPSDAVLFPKEIRSAQEDGSPPTPRQHQILEKHRRNRRRLSKQIRGDLDTVVLKALAKDGGQRYPSVEALIEDLHRYRNGLPVRARRAPWIYRARKFVGRHRLAVTAATATLLALLLGLAGTAWQAATAAQERDRAQLESSKLEATQEYLVSLFDAADPSQALGKDVTAKELVARGVERLDLELTDQPAVRLEMLNTLSRVSGALGELDQGEALLNQALPLAQELNGRDHPKVADVLVNLGRVLNEKGAWKEAQEVLEEALLLYQSSDREDRAMVFKGLSQLAYAHKSQGQRKEAALVLEEALGEARPLFGNESQEVADLLNDLGNALKREGKYLEAEASLTEALTIWRGMHEGDHPTIATATGNLAVLLFRKGHWEQAESGFREAIAMEQRIRGEKHPRLAAKLHNLANFLDTLGRFEEAAALRRQVLESVRESMGEASPYYGTTLDGLASDLAQTGRIGEAMPLFMEAERLLLAAVGPKHELYALNLSRRAGALHLQGKDREALPLIDEAIQSSRDRKTPESLAANLVRRGSIRLALGETLEAEEDFREGLRIQRETLPENHPNPVASLSGLGWALIGQERPSEALETLREAVALADKALPEKHWRRAEARAALGAALLGTQQQAEGTLLLRDALDTLEASRGVAHPTTRRAKSYLP